MKTITARKNRKQTNQEIFDEIKAANPGHYDFYEASRLVSSAVGREIKKSYLQQACVPSGLNLGTLKYHPNKQFIKLLNESDIAKLIEVFTNTPTRGKFVRKPNLREINEELNAMFSQVPPPATDEPKVTLVPLVGGLQSLRTLPKFSVKEAAVALGLEESDVKDAVFDEVAAGRLQEAGTNNYGRAVYRWNLPDELEGLVREVHVGLGQQLDSLLVPMMNQVREAKLKVENSEALVSDLMLQVQKLERENMELNAQVEEQQKIIVGVNSEKVRLFDLMTEAQNAERWANASFKTAEDALRRAQERIAELDRAVEIYSGV